MDASLFIGRRLRFKGKIVMTCVAVSFLIMIIAVSVSSGFRHEIREGISSVAGDVQLTRPDMNYMEEGSPIAASPSYISVIEDLPCTEAVIPAVYRAGIVKEGEDIYGVVVKGRPGRISDSLALAVAIPESFAKKAGISVGDRMLTYFVGEKMQVRQFNVAEIYESGVDPDGKFLVYADIEDIRRLNGWTADQASLLEVVLKPGYKTEKEMKESASQIGFIMNAYEQEDDDTLIATSAISKYPQLFGWLSLIDFNVFFILLLMTIVAGFNMISGLLIMLFENISTIGLLKSLGMTDMSISKVFLSCSAVLVLKGMAVGNAIAILFCIIQGTTHLLRLNPENYFVSYVPVYLDLGLIVVADLAAMAMIMLLLLIPSLFISKVDPAQTVRVR
ncbi:MAG: ABC transporter permease [Bacteroidales bacterium]|nr:ABC transporter permease [Bacteroidales bacterium]